MKPVLDDIERSANDLKELRVPGDPTQLAKLEPSILHAFREIEAGNDRLARLMDRLVDEGAKFEGLIGSAQNLMAALSDASVTLPVIATSLEAASEIIGQVPPAAGSEVALDDLFAQYTMARERTVHGEFLRRFGLTSNAAVNPPQADRTDDEVLLF